jgi:photosystem II stability/assembly factor-like uncharacterized protein
MQASNNRGGFAAFATVVLTISGNFAAAAGAAPDYSARVINPNLVGGTADPARGVHVLWGTDGTILYSRDGKRWDPATTPTARDLAAAAVDSKRNHWVAVGAAGEIIRSTDGAQTWQQAAAVGTEDLRVVLFDPNHAAWVAAGTAGSLLRSTDGGVTWKKLETGVANEFQALAREPRSGALLVGASDALVGRSTDGGASWRFEKLEMPEPLTPVVGFFECGGRLIGRSALGRVLLSRDGGESWRVIDTEGKGFFTDGICDETHGAIVLSSHLGNVVRSGDGGETWQIVTLQTGDNNKYLSALRAIPGSDALILGAHHGAAFRSTDGGASWQPASTSHTASMESLLVVGKRCLGFGGGGFLVATEDAGKSWRVQNPPIENVMREIVALPGSRGFVASGELGTILRSSDGGASWREVPVDYPNVNTPPNLRALALDPQSGALFAAGPPGTILRSDSDGARWQLAHWTPLEAEEAFPWLLVDPGRARVLVIEARGSFYRSTDSGRAWQRERVEESREFWQGALRRRDGWMLAAGQRGVAATSLDGGESWSLRDTGSEADLYGSYVDEKVALLLGREGTILRSVDDGASWQRVAVDSNRALRRALREPRSGALLAFGERGTLVRSTDDGVSWKLAPTNTDAELRTGLLEPGTGNVVLVGQRGVILRSTDGGQSFVPLESHTLRSLRGAAFDARTGVLNVVGERLIHLQPRRVSGR